MEEEFSHRSDRAGVTPRLSRLLNLVQLLNSGFQRNACELAELLGVSRRTVFRDLKTLVAAGVPLVYDTATQKYRIHRLVSYRFSLNVPDTLPFAIAIASTKVTPEMERAASLLEAEYALHLGPAAQPLFQSAVEWLKNERDPAPELAPNPQVRTLFIGYVNRTKVRIVYDTDDGESQGTLLSPHALILTNAGFEVSGWSSFHGRAIRVDTGKIVSAELTEDDYAVPERVRA